MDRINERIGKLIRRLMARVHPLPLKDAEIKGTLIDGREVTLPVFLDHKVEPKVVKDSEAKRKIMAVAPAKDAEPMAPKKILMAAGLSVSSFNRKKLWELVDDGELVSLEKGFRKAK